MKYALPLSMTMILLTSNLIGSSASASDLRETTVYHCGKDGKDLRDSPCPEAPAKAGSAVLYAQPDSQEQRAARERADADARRAQAMEKERLAAEAKAKRDAPMGASLGGAPAASAQKPAAHVKPPKPPKPIKLPKPPKPGKAASAPSHQH